MIEEQLVNYGILGIWTISLLIEKYKKDKILTNVIKETTKAIQENTYTNKEVKGVIVSCRTRNIEKIKSYGMKS